jgi:hypothetical protein
MAGWTGAIWPGVGHVGPVIGAVEVFAVPAIGEHDCGSDLLIRAMRDSREVEIAAAPPNQVRGLGHHRGRISRNHAQAGGYWLDSWARGSASALEVDGQGYFFGIYKPGLA